MHIVMKSKWRNFLWQVIRAHKHEHRYLCLYCTMQPNLPPPNLQELCSIISSSIGGLDELELNLNKFSASLTSSLVTQVIDSCKHEAPSRRLLRFFLWNRKNLNYSLEDKDYNHSIRVFAEKNDRTAMDILISDLRKEGRAMDTHTFSVVAETLVKLGREDEALGIFKNLDKYKCPQDRVTVTAIITALCGKGHARRAEGVVWHHKDKISGVEQCIYRSLLYGWSEQENAKEARRIIKEMKSAGFMPDLFCYNTFLRCLCERNLKRNPSGLVPETLNVMMEMRSYKIVPTSISYNILLSCLVRARRVKEACRILETMRKSGCSPDWTSYYLVARVSYLTGRYGKGNKIVDEMIAEGLVPDRMFYYDLIGILCGAERLNHALELFERMKRCSLGGYGPVYDVLIPKLCRGGDFEKGKELWNEAMGMGVTLHFSSDVLDPSITKVFKPTRNLEKVSLVECTAAKKLVQVANNFEKASNKKKKNKTGEVNNGRKHWMGMVDYCHWSFSFFHFSFLRLSLILKLFPQMILLVKSRTGCEPLPDAHFYLELSFCKG
ncbi:pentatricopeptide repeat-containing protein At5g61370, mitochondrial [Carya illinoinensis]|uniref:pentatricopeptide repeat-containing protein At5g61370, mitochondrial n=1 Tax=Carya illinoinensis TaxID=32201 RepID=UPI001C72749E|nr:pentatricopeptide repeat-containing protein At5g61370, mitochondrial [Carya illinoinensis]XP_042980858.1 pentatricopeptide repeat-containing protein At5g61370, mitochondrial [Carya illinoinensis]XP_042980859.1 pentatricopeptide repeat-containing protein At5g61370, mitochondrial [Carya illinoinensis]